ncbi:MAG: xyloglucanase precursor, partial [Aquabacterium sp.]|nr:xyloglucanase precursor [Ferruginibacter sp.]
MRKLNILLALCTFASLLSAQTISTNQFKNLKPRSIGPAGMSGRVTAIDALHSNPDIIYLGTASGGVWKTENGGSSWL